MVYSLILDPDLSLGRTPEIEILDGAIDKLELIDPTPDGGTNLNKPMQNGRALKPDHMPTKVRRLDERPIPDYRTWHYFYSVSDWFKEVVEKIEPGVHQFFAAEYVDRNGNHLANKGSKSNGRSRSDARSRSASPTRLLRLLASGILARFRHSLSAFVNAELHHA